MWPLMLSVSALLLWRPSAAAGDAEPLPEKLASGRPPRAVVDKLEAAFLHTLGMKRRPSGRVVVPEFLSEVYEKVSSTTRELNTLDLNLPGHMTGSANTVRTFVHSGEFGFEFELRSQRTAGAGSAARRRARADDPGTGSAGLEAAPMQPQPSFCRPGRD